MWKFLRLADLPKCQSLVLPNFCKNCNLVFFIKQVVQESWWISRTCSKKYCSSYMSFAPNLLEIVILSLFTCVIGIPANSRNKMMNNLKIRLLSPSNNRWQCCCLSWVQGRDGRDTSTSHTWKEHFSDDWTFIKKNSGVLLVKKTNITKGTTDADIQCLNSNNFDQTSNQEWTPSSTSMLIST